MTAYKKWNASERSDKIGLVVYGGSGLVPDCRGIIVDIDAIKNANTIFPYLLHEDAFHLQKEMLNWETSRKKNMERKLSEDVLFGQMIRFSSTSGSMWIKVFEREKSMIESRVVNGDSQIMLEGRINPDNPTIFYTEYVENLEIPRDLVSTALTNVSLKAWVSVLVEDSTVVRLKFHSFHDVSEVERMFDAGSAPWNLNNERYCLIQKVDSDDDDTISNMVEYLEPKKGSRPLELFKREAHMTGEMTFRLIEFPQYKCVLPFKKDDLDLTVGMLYRINCIWDPFHKFYIVLLYNHNSNDNRRNDKPKSVINVIKEKSGLPVDKQSNKIKGSVRIQGTIHGIFHNADFGYVDDPKGVLSLLHLTKLANNAIPVTFNDDGPNQAGQLRFRIHSIIGDKSEKLRKILENEEISVKNVKGVAIGENLVFSVEHGPIFFSFDENDNPPASGQCILFEAIYKNIKKSFVITSWRIIPDVDVIRCEKRRMVKKQREKQQNIFLTTAKRCVDKDLNKMLYSEDFGLIDDNRALVQLKEKNPYAVKYDVWVKRSEEDYDEHSPRTAFQIVGVSKKVPPNRFEIHVPTQEQNDWFRNFHQSSERESHVVPVQVRRVVNSKEHELNVLHNRFSGPRQPSETNENVSVSQNNLYSGHRQQSFRENENVPAPQTSRFAGPCFNYVENLYTGSGMRPFDNQTSILDDSMDRISISSHIMPSRQTHNDVDIDEHLPKKRNFPKYDGPVLLENNSVYKYDISETFSRISNNIRHDENCGYNCVKSCPNAIEIVRIMREVDHFFEETRIRYPRVLSALKEAIPY